MADLHDRVVAALQAAKPVTRESALAVARSVFTAEEAKSASQFETWFKSNGDTLVELVNNG
jgi:hypothetical protein